LKRKRKKKKKRRVRASTIPRKLKTHPNKNLRKRQWNMMMSMRKIAISDPRTKSNIRKRTLLRQCLKVKERRIRNR
jgi:hypothetical protein